MPDPFIAMSMAFTLILILLIGGFVLAFPLVRRLGGLMEEWIRERRTVRAEQAQLTQLGAAISSLREEVSSLERRLELVSERQAFTERLLEAGSEGGATPAGTEPAKH